MFSKATLPHNVFYPIANAVIRVGERERERERERETFFSYKKGCTSQLKATNKS